MVAALLMLLAAPQQEQEAPLFRAETSLAMVRFHVVRNKFYVQDLKPEDVVLLEDGAPQKITLFEGGQTARRTVPVEMALLFDTSGSVMQEGLLDPLSYKTHLLDGLLNVRLSVYGFDAGLRRFCGPTRDAGELTVALRRVLGSRTDPKQRPQRIALQLPPKRKSDPRGGTWIYEAVIGTARDITASKGNATYMIVIFSDGFATTTSQPEDAAKVAHELGVPVYTVVLGHSKITEQYKQVQSNAYNSQGVMTDSARDRLFRIEEREREILEFASLGELTGGRSYDPPLINLKMVSRILQGLAGQVQCEYVVGYSPRASGGQAKRRKLQVTLRSREMGKVLGGTRMIVN